MKVLIACEFSGVVRDAFLRYGYDAMSCDLIPTESPGPHYQGDVRDLLEPGKWDLMIAHPPCTYLARSGLHWLNKKPGRKELANDALDFVKVLLDAPIKFIALENPVGLIGPCIRPAEQIYQPNWFGQPDSKKTCLWLKNLPPLRPTEILEKPADGKWKNQTPNRQSNTSQHTWRGKTRSITPYGVGRAMAQQWGELVDKDTHGVRHFHDPVRLPGGTMLWCSTCGAVRETKKGAKWTTVVKD